MKWLPARIEESESRPCKEVCTAVYPSQADAQQKEMAVSEEENRAVSEWIVESDLLQLPHPVPVDKRDQSKEDVDERHRPGMQKDANPLVQFRIDTSERVPVDRDPVRKMVVRQIAGREREQYRGNGIPLQDAHTKESGVQADYRRPEIEPSTSSMTGSEAC